jgi:hypothetical protein
MARGRLAGLNITPDIFQLVYQCPRKKIASIIFSINNASDNPAEFDVGITNNTVTPIIDDYWMKGRLVHAKGDLERTGLVLDSEQSIVMKVYSNTEIFVQVYGYEDAKN